MNIATRARCALLDSGIKKHIPAAKSVHAICGKVKSSNDLRPKVSMVQMAGQANKKLTSPKPHDASKEPVTDAPAWENTVEL